MISGPKNYIAWDFTWADVYKRQLERDYDLADPESKTKFFYAVARKILNFEEELERENYIAVSYTHLGY